MDGTSRSRAVGLPLAFVIFVAGAAFLVLEVAWQRRLALVLGATVTASTVVLASFMAGWGAGAAVWGPLADRRDRPERLLALLLGGVGLGALAVSPLLRGWLPGVRAADPVVLGLAGALLFAVSFVMGGVFPTASRVLSRRLGRAGALGEALGRLYAVETLGAALGGLAAGFVLLGTVGQGATELLGAGLALVAAGVAATLRPIIAPESASESAPAATPSRRRGGPARDLGGVALGAAFVCGFTVLALQVFWLRMFRITLTNTSYMFALVASLAVLGLFLGSGLYARRAARVGDPGRELTLALGWLVLLGAAGVALAARLPQTLMFPLESLMARPLARAFLLPGLAAVLAVLPASVASGYAFPLACRLVAEARRGVGAGVGRVLLANTAGSVAGPLVATFVLLPVLGAVSGAVAVLGLAAAGGLLVSRAAVASPAGVRPALALGVAAAGGFLLMQPMVRIVPPSFLRFDRTVLLHLESVEGTLTVGVDQDSRTQSKYTFVDNSAVIGSSYDAVKVVKMVGHLPFLMGLEAEDVLVVGFGIGVTTSAIAQHGSVASIDCVELVPGLRDAAVFYRDLNRDIVRDRRLRLIPGDGRHHLARTERTYDLISCDPTHPVLGSGALYTRDYFQLCRDHLNPGGMVSQYLPLHKMRPGEFLGLIRTFGEIFPHATVWLGHYHAVLLGGLEPMETEWSEWEARTAALGRDPHFYIDPYHLASSLALTPDQVAALAEDYDVNTDDRSYTEFFHPDCLDGRHLTGNLRWFLDHRPELGAVVRGVPSDGVIDRYLEGNRLLTESLALMLERDRDASRAKLEEAVRVNPEDEEYPFLVKMYY